MTTSDNPMAFFRGGKSKAKGKAKRKPQVILHGRHGTMPDDEYHLWGWKTIFSENGEVRMTSELLAKGWHFNSFCEHQEDGGNNMGNGIWMMFTEEVTFRAGEGVWLMPSQCMKVPRVEIRE